jgi:hypothetical protein
LAKESRSEHLAVIGIEALDVGPQQIVAENWLSVLERGQRREQQGGEESEGGFHGHYLGWACSRQFPAWRKLKRARRAMIPMRGSFMIKFGLSSSCLVM